jgi:hypothetical protein
MENFTYHEGCKIFKEYAFKHGYKHTICGDFAFSKSFDNAQSKFIRLKSIKDGKLTVYESGKGVYVLATKQ